MIKLIAPENGSTVSLLTSIQKQFFKDEDKRAVIDENDFNWYAPEMFEDEHSHPEPVEFSWESDITQDAPYIVIISKNSDLSDPIVKVTFENSYRCYNLCVATKYYWCVQKNGLRSDTGYFFTADETPRGIRIEGLTNVRDLGGYKVPGGRIRQGLIYRGSEPDDGITITENGINEFLRLGIRTQIDFRNHKHNLETPCVLEPFGIKRIFIPVAPYMNLLDPKRRKVYHDCFKAFSQKNLYPIYFNCIAGADRTGCIAFLLEAFLGVEYSKIIDDYEYTTLSRCALRTRNHVNFVSMVEELNKFKGGTFQEKITDYLRTFLKVTDKQLDNIRKILIEPNN